MVSFLKDIKEQGDANRQYEHPERGEFYLKPEQ
jgi:hypothetical protein